MRPSWSAAPAGLRAHRPPSPPLLTSVYGKCRLAALRYVPAAHSSKSDAAHPTRVGCTGSPQRTTRPSPTKPHGPLRFSPRFSSDHSFLTIRDLALTFEEPGSTGDHGMRGMSLDAHPRHIGPTPTAGQYGGNPRCRPPGSRQACPAPGQRQSARADPGRAVGPTAPGACEDHRAHQLLPPRRAGRNGGAPVTRNPPARHAAVVLLATATATDRAGMVAVEPAHCGEKLVLLRPG